MLNEMKVFKEISGFYRIIPLNVLRNTPGVTFDNGGGAPIKGYVKRKNTSPLEKHSFFLGAQPLTSTALFNPQFRVRYFSLFGSRSGLLSVSSIDTDRSDPTSHPSGSRRCALG